MGMNNHTYLITVHLTANRMPHRHQSHPALQNKTLVNTNKGPDFNVPPRTFYTLCPGKYSAAQLFSTLITFRNVS